MNKNNKFLPYHTYTLFVLNFAGLKSLFFRDCKTNARFKTRE